MIRSVLMGVLGLSAALQVTALTVVVSQPAEEQTAPTNGVQHPTPTVTVTVTPSPSPTLAPIPRPSPTPTPTLTPTPSLVVVEPIPVPSTPPPTAIPVPTPIPSPTPSPAPTCTAVPGHEKHGKAVAGKHTGWANSGRSCVGPRR